MTMTTGELDFENLFHLSSANISENGDLTEISLFRVSYPMWILFLILMPILWSNLLVSIHAVFNEYQLNNFELCSFVS